jgi:hypothetical protein
MTRFAKLAAAVAVSVSLFGCGAGKPAGQGHGVYMLLDTSGTYHEELDKAKQIINYTLSRLDALDTFAVARIDTGSFSERDIMAKVTLDDRPSAANQQKREFAQAVDRFLDETPKSPYTDITGGLLQAVEFLNEKQPGRKTIFIFSDLKEDIQAGYVRDIDVPVAGFEVVALNVTKLRSDNVDPREYMTRLEEWKRRIEAEGGTWRVINDLDRLETLL